MAETTVLTLDHATIATLKVNATLGAGANAAAVVKALADQSPKSHDESKLYEAACAVLQYQFTAYLEDVLSKQ